MRCHDWLQGILRCLNQVVLNQPDFAIAIAIGIAMFGVILVRVYRGKLIF